MNNVQKILDSLYRMGGLIPALGIELGIDGEDIVCRMPVHKTHTGAPGVAHGGAVMALLDTALGARAMLHAVGVRRATSTVELKVNFLRPVKAGRTLVTSSTIQSSGQSLLVISGTASDEETGKQVGFAVGTYNLYEAEDLEAWLKTTLG